ncbi:winged helix-turn-helix transcriptional regulator [Baekduia soli]|uniref:Winged helix-turn-helix transcriptional regulator n=2 Tax=Baekduia soli TaxID=496014 RepID=A0A5B8UBY3_9ACTN|nr:winged helix-turn-helix transcriptional regulator [Baekduia soli]
MPPLKPITAIDDPRYVKAMSHPVRVRIMAMLSERKASPNELSQWLGTTLGATAYHVRTLHKLGLIELVDETRVRGAVEHHYKARARPKVTEENWSKASPVAKQAAVGSELKMLEDVVNASAASGGFDRADAVLERRTARVDERGFKALAAEAQKFLARVEKIEAEAARRLSKADHNGALDAGVVLLSYESVALGEQIPESTKKSTPLKRPRRR